MSTSTRRRRSRTGDRPLVFQDDKLIRFHHCDPAGIIFYPQYFILFNELVEDWFTRGLGVSFVDQVTKDRVSIPMGRVECDFLAPSKIGDVLRFALAVERIGSSSIRLRIEVRHGTEVRVRARLTVVLASLETLRSVPVSDDLRARMSPTSATPACRRVPDDLRARMSRFLVPATEGR